MSMSDIFRSTVSLLGKSSSRRSSSNEDNSTKEKFSELTNTSKSNSKKTSIDLLLEGHTPPALESAIENRDIERRVAVYEISSADRDIVKAQVKNFIVRRNMVSHEIY